MHRMRSAGLSSTRDASTASGMERAEIVRKAARARWGDVRMKIKVPVELFDFINERADKRRITPEAWLLRLIDNTRKQLAEIESKADRTAP
jgi:hypothetical protein